MPPWLSSVLGGAASFGLSSLFGGGPKVNPYYQQMQAQGLAGLGQVAGQAGQLGAQGRELSSYTMPAYTQQLQNVGQMLTQDPYTDAYRTAQINQATGGVGSAYQQGAAQLQSQLAQRGLDSSGLMAGGLADLDASRAGALASPMLGVGLNAVQTRTGNNLQWMGLLGSANQDATNMQQNANQQQMGAYGQMGSLANQGQGQNLLNNQYQQNMWQQLMGGVGGGLGNIFGNPGTGRRYAPGAFGPGFGTGYGP